MSSKAYKVNYLINKLNQYILKKNVKLSAINNFLDEFTIL